jgi:hypothetical protein
MPEPLVVAPESHMLWSNNASSTISGSITASDTTVVLAAGTGQWFPQPLNPGDFFKATLYDQQTKTVNEIIHVTARGAPPNNNPDELTIVRGRENTTPRAWTAGDILANLITADTLARFVQQSGPAADTSIVYVGIDTSTDIHKIVANTTPIPASLQIGMLFNIKMLNAKLPPVNSPGPPPVYGAVNMELNGQAGIPVKKTDGSNWIGGETIGAQEYIFVYNGVSFTSTLQNVKPTPPQYVFYVNGTYGNDYNTGFSDNGTPSTEAFKTCQGAINRIKERYTSSTGITVRVADGTYPQGFGDSNNYIAGWSFIGNSANPEACVIDASSTSLANYTQNGSPTGIGVAVGALAAFYIEGFKFRSQYPNVLCGGSLSIKNCHFTAPLYSPNDVHCIIAESGSINISGSNTYAGAGVACGGLFEAGANGVMGLGSEDPLYGNNVSCTFTFLDTPSFATHGGGYGAVATAETNALIVFTQNMTTFVLQAGKAVGHEYICTMAGGIYFDRGAINGWLPATMPGVVDSTSYGWVL